MASWGPGGRSKGLWFSRKTEAGMTCPTKAKKESARLVFSFATKNKGGGIGKNRDVIFVFKMCLIFLGGI